MFMHYWLMDAKLLQVSNFQYGTNLLVPWYQHAGACPAICHGLLRSPASATQHSTICPVICVSVAGRRPRLIAAGPRKCDMGQSSGQPAQPSPVRHQCGSSVDRRSPSLGAYYRCSRQFPLVPSASSSNSPSLSTELFTALHLST